MRGENMIVGKIRNNKKIYTSVIFAIKFKGWSSEVIAFDEEYTKLILVKQLELITLLKNHYSNLLYIMP